MSIFPRLLLAGLVLPVGHAIAQTLPWPGDAPQAGAQAPWPGAAPPGSPPPTAPRPAPPMMGGGAGASPCMAEFTRLRGDVEKKGMAAKTAGQRHVPREEMCKLIMSYADAEAAWVRFTTAGVQSCGVPVQIAAQLKQVHANTERTREKFCAGPVTGNDAPIWNNDARLWFLRK